LLLPGLAVQTGTSKPHSPSYIDLLPKVEQAQFPDMSANYEQTVLIPQQKPTQEAAEAARKAAEAQVVIITPPPPPVVSTGSVQAIIIAAAQRHGVDPNRLLRVANCESGFNIYAHNPSGATGLFQFMPRTFYGNGGTDLYSAYDQSEIAAKMFAAGQSGQWVCQ